MEVYTSAINKLELSELQKLQIQERVIYIIEFYKKNRLYYSVCYYGGKSVITLGSILVPSLMSHDLYNNSINTYWFVFIISLFVTIANGFMTAFNIDTKFLKSFLNFAFLIKFSLKYFLFFSCFHHLNISNPQFKQIYQFFKPHYI
jgi:hypothetical protein